MGVHIFFHIFSFDYIYSATYGGPAGQLTQVQYPIFYYGGQRVQTLYTYPGNSMYPTHIIVRTA